MSEEGAVLKEVCQRLERGRIPYMITGSIAANFYAVPRMTRDIDMVIEIQKEDAAKIAGLFQDDFYIDPDSVTEAIENQGMFNLIHQASVIKIDLIVRKETAYRKLEFQRRRAAEWEGQRIWMVSPEDLILSKLFWAKDNFSEMQLRDVKNLLKTVKDLDGAYLNLWIRSLGLEEVYRRAGHE